MDIQENAALREVGERVALPMLIQQESTRDLGDGCVECVVTTPSIDRYDESINTEGVDTSSYLQNPVVLYSHEYGQLPIGKSVRLVQQKNAIKSTTQFATDEYDFADTVYKMVKGGYLNDVSIGVLVRSWSEDFKTIEESEMVEYSHCPIGANRDAKVTARAFQGVHDAIEHIGKNPEQVAEEYADFVARTMQLKIQKMPYDDITSSIRVLKGLVDTLEASATPDHSSGTDQIRKIKRLTTFKTAQQVATQSQHVIRTIKMRERLNGTGARN